MDQLLAGVNIYHIFFMVVAVIGTIIWLVRLESRANTNTARLEEERSSRKEDLQREKDDRKEADKELTEKVAMTNTRISLTETQINELRVTAITRDDLREVEQRVTKSIDGLGERLEKYFGPRQPDA